MTTSTEARSVPLMIGYMLKQGQKRRRRRVVTNETLHYRNRKIGERRKAVASSAVGRTTKLQTANAVRYRKCPL